MRATLRSRLATMRRVVLISMLIGAFVGPFVGSTITGELLFVAVLQGMLSGATIAAWCSAYDLLLLPSPRLRLDRLPFSVHVLAKTLWFTAGIVGTMVLYEKVFAPLYGAQAVAVPSYIGWMTPLSLGVAFVISLVMSVSRLLGPRVFASLILGRYHRPREEERIFLFVDLTDSTRTAERIGPLRFHALLRDVVADLTESILAAKGEIYGYVGDEVIVTWTLDAGLPDARCLTCQFDMRDQLARRADDYRARYGLMPDFRAALHCGPVVLGELGVVRQAIVVLGDTVNTTARLEQACRDLGEPFLVSGDLLRRVALPDGFRARSLGTRMLRGKEAGIEVFAVARD